MRKSMQEISLTTTYYSCLHSALCVPKGPPLRSISQPSLLWLIFPFLHWVITPFVRCLTRNSFRQNVTLLWAPTAKWSNSSEARHSSVSMALDCSERETDKKVGVNGGCKQRDTMTHSCFFDFLLLWKKILKLELPPRCCMPLSTSPLAVN